MIGKILNYIGLDGMAHIIVSAVMLLALQIFLPWWVAVPAVMLIGVAKEVIYDKWLKKGTPQWKDIICDIVGIAIGCMGYFNI